VVNDERRGLDKEGGGGTGFLIEEGAVGARQGTSEVLVISLSIIIEPMQQEHFSFQYPVCWLVVLILLLGCGLNTP